MKTLLRNVAINTLALYLLPFLVPGVEILDVTTLIFGSIILTLMLLILKPIFNILTFPLNLVTLGLFSIFTNALILYLLTVFVPGIIINAFTYPGADILGFIIPQISLSTLFAFLTASIVLAMVTTGIRWLVE